MALTLPDNYAYVIIGSLTGHFAANMVLAYNVMSARSKFNVPYPNLYAVPGYHEDADAFNRVQRGHQNMLETLSLFLGMSLIGGLKYPIPAAIIGAIHCLGCVLYQVGYGDNNLDVKTARFMKGGFLKSLSELAVLIMIIPVIYELLA